METLNCFVRNATINDFEDAARILNQVQKMHVEWRPDIYKPNEHLIQRDLFETMAIDEPYRGMGIGHLFFEKLQQIKEEKHFDVIELQVNARNRAAYEMYSNYGFTEKSINMELL